MFKNHDFDLVSRTLGAHSADVGSANFDSLQTGDAELRGVGATAGVGRNAMSIIEKHEKKVQQLLDQTGVTRFAYFIYIITVATLSTGYLLPTMSPDIDWSDRGTICIMTITAGACYAAVWMYMKRFTAPPKG